MGHPRDDASGGVLPDWLKVDEPPQQLEGESSGHARRHVRSAPSAEGLEGQPSGRSVGSDSPVPPSSEDGDGELPSWLAEDAPSASSRGSSRESKESVSRPIGIPRSISASSSRVSFSTPGTPTAHSPGQQFLDVAPSWLSPSQFDKPPREKPPRPSLNRDRSLPEMSRMLSEELPAKPPSSGKRRRQPLSRVGTTPVISLSADAPSDAGSKGVNVKPEWLM
jgi:hypothetical protein